MRSRYRSFRQKAYQDALTVEILSQDADVVPEAIVFHAHRAIQNMLWNIFEENEVGIIDTQDLAFLLQYAVDNHWMCITDDELRCAVLLTQYAAAARYTNNPDIEREEALNAITLSNKLMEVFAYNCLPSYRVKTARTGMSYFRSPQRINLSPLIIDKIVQSITSAVDTRTIYIFGSYARREEHMNSDVDIYVVTNSENVGRVNFDDIGSVRKALFWMNKPKDIFCMSKNDFENASKNPCGLEKHIIEEGIIIYEQ